MAQDRPELSVNGWNGEYIEALHQRWSENPDAVDPQWRQFFEGFELGSMRLARLEESGALEAAIKPSNADHLPPAPSPGLVAVANSKQARVDSLIYHYRDIGHRAAELDPLGRPRPFPEELTLDSFDLTDADLAESFDPGVLPLESPAPLSKIIELLEDTYCRTIGVEYLHIQERERRRWLQRRMETVRNHPPLAPEARIHILRQLIDADAFENFLHARYVGKKRFGLEGGESLIPLLDQFIQQAPANGIEEYAMGMPHRGRLNVLVNILEKTYAQVFTEFDEAWVEDFVEGGGDVKYHQGYSSDRTTTGGQVIHLTMAANPSHLEFISAVVLGRCRAKQRLYDDTKRERVVPILIHGDAAFPGQGVVAETLNMMKLDGYNVGGTIHVIINNQVGFTTDPRDGFSGLYCTDIAKMVDAPIFHVNGDDPEACAWVARMALEYRQAFKNDVVIDMWCYRKHGHNETDEPSFTQPLMYKLIRRQKPVLQTYTERLVQEGVVTVEQAKAMHDETTAAMDHAQTVTKEKPVDPTVDPFAARWSGLKQHYSFEPINTAVPLDRLIQVSKALGSTPPGFALHKTMSRILAYRGSAIERGEPIDWGLAELLAYGTLLVEGHAVRLTGQDVERGTFSHRHAVVFDQETGESYTGLNAIDPAQARFCIHNSPLSEAACLGFEYGYSLTDPQMLILWEAQFGDFANGAQVIIDQFIASAQAKWQRYNGLVMLLPHGYEGQGPEHSSARLERFLQLCANQNMQVCYPTTAAQMFHLLRRQVMVGFRKPLIVMTPKSMLRLPAAASTAADLVGGGFEMVIDDTAVASPASVTRLILCSGKIGHELAAHREKSGRDDIAIVRLEQLHPFPLERLQEVLNRYPNATDFVWAQEEPRNMGAWRFVEAMFHSHLDLHFNCISRPASATPAAGSSKIHAQEQETILIEAVGLPVDASGAASPTASTVH
ncbi:MAG: 2-oxoglutarate dehydrogenase E1 component [Phycisphaerales bacterium]|nr:2-oxoglutarate dehydrogenase E1 component [Phycisphaerales bacterium]